MKPVCFFTIAGGGENERYAKMMANSLKKFHPDIPHIIKPFEAVHNFRVYATVGKELAKEYDLVINIDNDSIVTGSLDHIINDDSYDVGGVLNNNLIDPKLAVWDTSPDVYINAGLVAIRGTRPWEWWNKLNYSSHWDKYKFREQDMLNIMFHYGDLRTKIFDHSDNWHGLIHKGQWDKFVMKGTEMVLPKTEGVCDKDKTIKCIHWAGGNSIPKMNYFVHFQKEVADRIHYLVGDKK